MVGVQVVELMDGLCAGGGTFCWMVGVQVVELMDWCAGGGADGWMVCSW